MIGGQTLNLEELEFQVFGQGVVKIKLPLEHAVGETAAALQQLDRLVDEIVEFRGAPSRIVLACR